MSNSRHKLSASALSTFLKSPKQFWYRYKAQGTGLEPLTQSVSSFDHDKIAGVVWSAFVDRFYRGVDEKTNLETSLGVWLDGTNGWVPQKTQDRLTVALQTLGAYYYQNFEPADGVRCQGQSELFVENDRFQGFLDGFCDGIVHEVKMTSRSPQLMSQLWKVENSIQVKLYCVLTKATGRIVEFAWKDTPHSVYRGQMNPVSADQLKAWEQELNGLADYIYSLGDDPDNYPCHPDGCCLITKNYASLCPYSTLCDMGLNEITSIAYKPKTRRT